MRRGGRLVQRPKSRAESRKVAESSPHRFFSRAPARAARLAPSLCTAADGADRTNRLAADQELGDEERPWWRARWVYDAQIWQIRAAVRDLASMIRRSTKTPAASASLPISKARNRTRSCAMR